MDAPAVVKVIFVIYEEVLEYPCTYLQIHYGVLNNASNTTILTTNSESVRVFDLYYHTIISRPIVCATKHTGRWR